MERRTFLKICGPICLVSFSGCISENNSSDTNQTNISNKNRPSENEGVDKNNGTNPSKSGKQDGNNDINGETDDEKDSSNKEGNENPKNEGSKNTNGDNSNSGNTDEDKDSRKTDDSSEKSMNYYDKRFSDISSKPSITFFNNDEVKYELKVTIESTDGYKLLDKIYELDPQASVIVDHPTGDKGKYPTKLELIQYPSQLENGDKDIEKFTWELSGDKQYVAWPTVSSGVSMNFSKVGWIWSTVVNDVPEEANVVRASESAIKKFKPIHTALETAISCEDNPDKEFCSTLSNGVSEFNQGKVVQLTGSSLSSTTYKLNHIPYYYSSSPKINGHYLKYKEDVLVLRNEFNI